MPDPPGDGKRRATIRRDKRRRLGQLPGRMVVAYLGLGANLGEPIASLNNAVERLRSTEGVQVLRRAPTYRTRPVGPPGQPDYLNSAVEIETTLPPLELLDRLKAIEAQLGRTPGERWGPRIIDLDLLLYGAEVVALPRLTIPHPELVTRRFALAPLADLASSVEVPGTGRSVGEWLSAVGGEGDVQQI